MATDTTEAAFLRDCWERDICPYCGRKFDPSERVGSGEKSKGGFCSLHCYTEYYKHDIAERQSRILKQSRGTQ